MTFYIKLWSPYMCTHTPEQTFTYLCTNHTHEKWKNVLYFWFSTLYYFSNLPSVARGVHIWPRPTGHGELVLFLLWGCKHLASFFLLLPLAYPMSLSLTQFLTFHSNTVLPVTVHSRSLSRTSLCVLGFSFRLRSIKSFGHHTWTPFPL